MDWKESHNLLNAASATEVNARFLLEEGEDRESIYKSERELSKLWSHHNLDLLIKRQIQDDVIVRVQWQF